MNDCEAYVRDSEYVTVVNECEAYVRDSEYVTVMNGYKRVQTYFQDSEHRTVMKQYETSIINNGWHMERLQKNNKLFPRTVCMERSELKELGITHKHQNRNST